MVRPERWLITCRQKILLAVDSMMRGRFEERSTSLGALRRPGRKPSARERGGRGRHGRQRLHSCRPTHLHIHINYTRSYMIEGLTCRRGSRGARKGSTTQFRALKCAI